MKHLFYVGTMNRPSDLSPLPHAKGISAFELDDSDGRMQPAFTECAAELDSPTFLTVHPRLNILYAVSSGPENNREETSSADLLTSYRILPDGHLNMLAIKSTKGKNPCHLCIHPNLQWLFTPNYSSGNTVFARLKSSGDTDDIYYISHKYQNPTLLPETAARQETAHPHCATVSPDGRFVILCDLGSNGLWTFDLQNFTQDDSCTFTAAPTGSGPRHAVFSEDGRRFYVFCELSCTLDLYAFEPTTGRLTFQTSQPAWSDGTNQTFGKESPQGAEIVCHPNRKYLYLSLRGANTISVFQDTDAGPVFLQEVAAGGEIPRFISFDLTGKFLLACCQKTGQISSFRVDALSGRVTPTGFSVAAPWCAVLAFAHPS